MGTARWFAGVCVGAILVAGGCSQAPIGPADFSPPDTAPSIDTIVYTVTGAATDMITYTNSTGNTAQITDTIGLPWTVTFSEPSGTEGFLYVSAQNSGYGAIGCSISINGTVQTRNTSTGEYAIVDCSR